MDKTSEQPVQTIKRIIGEGNRVSVEMLELGFNTPKELLTRLTHLSSREALSMAITDTINASRTFVAQLSAYHKYQRQLWSYKTYDARLKTFEKSEKERQKWRKQRPKTVIEPVKPKPPSLSVKMVVFRDKQRAAINAQEYKTGMEEYHAASKLYKEYQQELKTWEENEPVRLENPGARPEEPATDDPADLEDADYVSVVPQRPEMFFLSDFFITKLKEYKLSVEGRGIKELYNMGKIALEVDIEESDQMEPTDAV